MQEEVTQRTVALCVEATKLSAGMLQQAMKKVLDEMQKGVTDHKSKLHHGKQTLRQLMKHNTGVSNIEITDQNIRAFSATAKKYGIDFALKKDTSGEIPRYLVFFKGRDADVITAAFREFSAKNLEKEKKPSIRAGCPISWHLPICPRIPICWRRKKPTAPKRMNCGNTWIPTRPPTTMTSITSTWTRSSMTPMC